MNRTYTATVGTIRQALLLDANRNVQAASRGISRESTAESRCAEPLAANPPAGYVLWEGGPLVGARLVEGGKVPLPSRAVAVLSSRLGGPIETRKAWRLRMSHLFRALSGGSRVVVTCEGTTSDRCLMALAATGEFPIVRAVAEEAQHDSVCGCCDWLDARESLRCRDVAPLAPRTFDGRPGIQEIRISPQLLSRHATIGPSRVGDCEQAELRAIPLRDRLLVALADDIYVMHARAGGTIARLISHGLRAGAFRHKRLFLATGRHAIPPQLGRPWLARGGIEWTVLAATESATLAADADLSRAVAAPIDIRSVPAPDDRSYLYHWTRRPLGPWPDQSEQEHIEVMIRNPLATPRSAQDALARIVRQKKLVATARLTRGDQPVVCFTERTLHEFPHLRRFRRHQSRWDFEFVGIAVARDWLLARGARPVVYGDQQTWSELPSESRPYFQPYHGRGNHSDWHCESEWRVLNDVDLTSATGADAFLFIASRADAQRFAGVSDWPICIVGEGIDVAER